MKDRDLSIDFIRVLSVLLIVFYHLHVHMKINGQVFDNYPRVLNAFGTFGVSWFIILSGIALYNLSKNISTIEFYKARWLSIMPLYYVSYMFILIVYLVVDKLSLQFILDNYNKFLFTLIGMDGYLIKSFDTIYLIGEWFTGFILIIYFIYPVIKKAMDINPYITFTLSLIASYLSVKYNSDIVNLLRVYNNNPYWNPLARLPEFIFGMISYRLIRKSTIRFELIVLGCFLLLQLLPSPFNQDVFKFRFEYLIVSILLFVIVWWLCDISYNLWSKLTSIILFMSTYSFAAFLVHHKLILFFVNSLEGKVSNFSFIIIGIGIVALSYMVGFLLQSLINKDRYYCYK